MKLNPMHNTDCVWCGRRLVRRGLQVGCGDGFALRSRSEEPVISQPGYVSLRTGSFHADLTSALNQENGGKGPPFPLQTVVALASVHDMSPAQAYSHLLWQTNSTAGGKVAVALKFRHGSIYPHSSRDSMRLKSTVSLRTSCSS
jgi:hypothetical protein